jgi:hypothetical protein
MSWDLSWCGGWQQTLHRFCCYDPQGWRRERTLGLAVLAQRRDWQHYRYGRRYQPTLLLLALESKRLRVSPVHEAILADELGLGKAIEAGLVPRRNGPKRAGPSWSLRQPEKAVVSGGRETFSCRPSSLKRRTTTSLQRAASATPSSRSRWRLLAPVCRPLC